MTATALVLLAEGAEEMETVISVDVLRRAKIDVTVAGLDDGIVTCSRGICIKPDTTLANLKETLYDVVVLPGGLGGAKKLAESAEVGKVLKQNYDAGKTIAAICAAPTALAAHNIGTGKKVTSYPADPIKDKLADYIYSEERVVKDGNLITSRGPGTSFEFALEIVSTLCGNDTASKLKQEMLLRY